MSVDGIPGTSTYTPTVGNDLAWQQASQRAQRHFRRVHSVDAMLVRYEHLLATLGTPR